MTREMTGMRGELEAARYLRKHGYSIVTANYRCRMGEIDIIAENKDCICFVEVKTRAVHSRYAPADAVTGAKRKRLIAAASLFLAQTPTKKQPRFDIVEVYMQGEQVQSVRLIPNAFDANGR